MRKVIREERGITSELNKEVERIEKRINRAERYMQDEVRGELNRSARGKRINTGKDKGTDR